MIGDRKSSHLQHWVNTLKLRRLEWLVLLFVLLLPYGETSHLPVVILVVLGIRGVWKSGWQSGPESGAYRWVALALIVPLLVATTGAYNPQKTLLTAGVFALYAFAGGYVVKCFQERLDTNLLLYGIGGILLFWTGDALLQYVRGTNLFGWPGYADGVTGMYNTNFWIGYTFAHLAPFLFEFLRRLASGSGRKWVWLLIIPFVMVIMLSGRRAAWLTLVLVSALYLLWLVRHGDIRRGHAALGALAAAAAVGASIALSPGLQSRIETSLQVFGGTWEAVNAAGAHRLEVWIGAWLLYQESPFTGWGAQAYDPLVFERGYTTMPFGHSHLYGLDVLLSTGLLGFIAYMAAFGYLFYRLSSSIKAAAPDVAAWLAAVSIMLPLNAHWNFYAPRPASLLWMLLILAFAMAVHAKVRESPPAVVQKTCVQPAQ